MQFPELILKPDSREDIILHTVESKVTDNADWFYLVLYSDLNLNESEGIEHQYSQNDPLISATYIKNRGSLKDISFPLLCVAKDKSLALQKIRELANVISSTKGMLLYKPSECDVFTYYYYLQSPSMELGDYKYDFKYDDKQRIFISFNVVLKVLPIATSDPNTLINERTFGNLGNNYDNILIPKDVNSGDKETSLKVTITNTNSVNINTVYINTSDQLLYTKYSLNGIAYANSGELEANSQLMSNYFSTDLHDYNNHDDTYVVLLHNKWSSNNNLLDFYKFRLYMELGTSKIYLTDWIYSNKKNIENLEYVGQFKLLPFDIIYNVNISPPKIGIQLAQDTSNILYGGDVFYVRSLYLFKMKSLIQVNLSLDPSEKLEIFRNNKGISTLILDANNNIIKKPTSIFGSHGILINSHIDNYLNVLLCGDSFNSAASYNLDIKKLYRTTYPLSI